MRGATPRLRSGAEARRTPCPKDGRQEELTQVRGKGQQPRVPGCYGAEMAERNYPASKVRGGDERSYPVSEVRDSGREDQPHVQGAVATRAQEGLEELSHVEGQEGRQ